MKKVFLMTLVLMVLGSVAFAEDIAKINVKKSLFGNDVIQVKAFEDPEMPFITIYLTTVKSGKLFTLSDPSNSSISARLTGKVGKIIFKDNMAVINLKKSIGWKKLKIARFYDIRRNVMIYVSYSTKIIDGSYKHSLSVVPLGNH